MSYKWILVIITILIASAITIWFSMTDTNKKNISIINKPTYIPPTNKYFGVNVAGAEFDNMPFYTDNDYQGYKYFNKNNLTLIRIPVKWERIQPEFQGPLSSEIDKYTDMINQAQSAGNSVIIDLHNYARYNDTPLTTYDSLNLADIWGKIAKKYSEGYPGLFGYELMNEPHDLEGECETWKTIAQDSIYEIRKIDNTHYIIVPGYDWQSATRWADSSNCLADIKDPANKILFSAHQYFDSDYSGTKYDSTTCTDTQLGSNLAEPFLNWLQKNKSTGIFTEYGVPATDVCWLNTMDNFLKTLNNNKNIIGGTYWSAGPAWGDYPLSVEPTDNKDKPQITVLKKYPSTSQP